MPISTYKKNKIDRSVKEAVKGIRAGIQHHSYDSTCIANITFDAEEDVMIIQFQERGTYRYNDVPIDIYRDLSSASLKGSYFNLYVRPVYNDYERIS